MALSLTLTVLSAAVAYGVTGVAARQVWLPDIPKGRSNHRHPVSRAGGVVVLILISLLVTGWGLIGVVDVPKAALIGVGAGLLGLLDDVTDMPARLKFAALLVLCGIGVALTGPVTGLPLPAGMTDLPAWAGYLVGVIFLFGFVNMLNFMDGLNGIAGGAALVGLGLMTLLSAPVLPGMALVSMVAAAALYGFLLRNVRADGIFLGDAGSLSAGLFLSAASLETGQYLPAVPYLLGVTFLPFIADVAVTLLLRARRGENVLEAHNQHIYQRLRRGGWSHQAVALAYGVLVLVSGILAVGSQQMFGSLGLYAAALVSLLLTGGVWRVMWRHPVTS